MKPRITVLTIGVDDLERSLKFYRDGLGLKTDGIVGQEFEKAWQRMRVSKKPRPAQPN
jgi:catechol 2,3-dioxygenase-like lactoylglutathione lyase family enzyme